MNNISRRGVLAGVSSAVLLSPAYGLVKRAAGVAMPPHRMVLTNGVRLNVYEAGRGPAILLLHGFPGLAYSWTHQIPALVAAGYRVIVPDLRGYGQSEIPSSIDAYDLKHLLGDLIGLLDALHVDKAVIVGHDWGGILAWQMPLFYPERVAGIIGVSTPFIPHWQLWLQPDTLRFLGPKARAFVPDPRVDPIAQMREVYTPDQYVLMFYNGTDEADQLMNRDPRRTLDTLMRNQLSAAAYAKLPPVDHEEAILNQLRGPAQVLPGKSILNPQELETYAASFKRTGFTPGINYYRNISRNWRAGLNVNQRIDAPSLMVSAADDLVLTPGMTDNMGKYVPNLEKHIIDKSGHFIQQDRPDAFNEIVINWLRRRVSGQQQRR